MPKQDPFFPGCTECGKPYGHGHVAGCSGSFGSRKAIPTHEEMQERAAFGDVCGPFTPEKNHFGKGEPIPNATALDLGGDMSASARPILEEDQPVAHESGEGYGRPTALDYAAAHAELDALFAPIREAALDKLMLPQEPVQSLPTSALARKELPLASGLLDYFPAALIAVAGLSRIGNEQHNPGQPLAWDRSKSGDESDALLRHLVDRGTIDTDGVRHSTKVAWRALALLQKELEAAGLAPLSRGSR